MAPVRSSHRRRVATVQGASSAAPWIPPCPARRGPQIGGETSLQCFSPSTTPRGSAMNCFFGERYERPIRCANSTTQKTIAIPPGGGAEPLMVIGETVWRDRLQMPLPRFDW